MITVEHAQIAAAGVGAIYLALALLNSMWVDKSIQMLELRTRRCTMSGILAIGLFMLAGM